MFFSAIFCYILFDFRVKTGTRFSLLDKLLFEISEVEITRVRCSLWRNMITVYLGPVVQSVVSLTSWLRVISLTVLADSIYNILLVFAEKM